MLGVRHAKITLIFDCKYGIIFFLKYIHRGILGLDENIFKISAHIIGTPLHTDGLPVSGT
jgi:hypothetical protein